MESMKNTDAPNTGTQQSAAIPVASPVPQSGLTRPEKIALWFLSAAAIAILGFIFTLHGNVRALEGQYGSVDKHLGSMDSRIGEFKDRFHEFDRRFDQIDKGITEVKHDVGEAAAMIRGVMSRQYMVEADPESLAEQMGYKLGSGYKARFVEGRLYLFPQNDQAEADIKGDGRFVRVKLSPVLFAWEIRKMADAIETPPSQPDAPN